MQNVLSGTISVVQCSSSIGTVWKSSSSSDELSGELSDELSGSWSLAELSERNMLGGSTLVWVGLAVCHSVEYQLGGVA